LVSGNPIQAAGEVKIVSGQIKYIDNSSGHYLPNGESVQKAAGNGFATLGFDVNEKYLEKEWVQDSKLVSLEPDALEDDRYVLSH
jgi:filamentous hemagglutinin